MRVRTRNLLLAAAAGACLVAFVVVTLERGVVDHESGPVTVEFREVDPPAGTRPTPLDDADLARLDAGLAGAIRTAAEEGEARAEVAREAWRRDHATLRAKAETSGGSPLYYAYGERVLRLDFMTP